MAEASNGISGHAVQRSSLPSRTSIHNWIWGRYLPGRGLRRSAFYTSRRPWAYGIVLHSRRCLRAREAFMSARPSPECPFLHRSSPAKSPGCHDGFVCLVYGWRRARAREGRERGIRVGAPSSGSRYIYLHAPLPLLLLTSPRPHKSRVRRRLLHRDGHRHTARRPRSQRLVRQSRRRRRRARKTQISSHPRRSERRHTDGSRSTEKRQDEENGEREREDGAER